MSSQYQRNLSTMEVNSITTDQVPPSIVDESKNVDHDDYFDSFPPGYRFCPTDGELVVHYLEKKVQEKKLPRNRIMDVEFYKYDPENLAEKYKSCGEKEWYFFTPRDRKYPNGSRPNRGADSGSGFWKATGADRPVKHNGVEVGQRKALVYYRGKPPKGEKTDWIMHEYRLNDHPQYKRNVVGMRLDECVLCRIYKKANKSVKTETADDDHSLPGHHEETNEEHLGVDCDKDNVDHDPTMYTNTYGDYMLQPYQHGLPQIPPYSNNVAFGNQLEAMNANYDTQPKMVQPICRMPPPPPPPMRSPRFMHSDGSSSKFQGQLLPMQHSNENIFKSSDLDESSFGGIKSSGFADDIIMWDTFRNLEDYNNDPRLYHNSYTDSVPILDSNVFPMNVPNNPPNEPPL